MRPCSSLWFERRFRFDLAMGVLLGLLTACGRQPEAPTEAPRPREPFHVPVPVPRVQRAPPEERDDLVSAPEPKGEERAVGEGLFYTNERIREGPLSINLLKIERARTNLELTSSLGGDSRFIGLNTLSEQVGSTPAEAGQPLAAINGDFFRTEQDSYAGDPRGLHVLRGELTSAPNGKTAFWIRPDGQPMMGNVTSKFRVTWPEGETMRFGLNEERRAHEATLFTPAIGRSTGTRGGRELVLEKFEDGPWLPLAPGQTYRARVRQIREGGNSRLSSEIMILSLGPAAEAPEVKPGEVLQISTATVPDLAGVRLALGGGPVLVHGGKAQPAYANRSRERNPRTAFGWNDHDYFFVEVDGRQPGFSVGMNLPELAHYLANQGVQEAMNLDGGASSEMWIEGRVVSRPCYGQERNTANALILVRKDPAQISARAN